MAAKPQNRAGRDADAVARLMREQEEREAQEVRPVAEPEAAPAPASPPAASASVAFDPGRVDGRTLRRTGREPFATRIKPEAHQTLRRIAHRRGITIAEALELAVAAFESR